MIPDDLKTPAVSGGAKLIWVCLRANPGTSPRELEDATGMSDQQVAAALSQLRARDAIAHGKSGYSVAVEVDA